MNNLQIVITVAVVVLGTALTRFLPFLIFRDGKGGGKFITYMGKALPPAVFALLVVYCLKGVSLTAFPHGIPEAIAVICVILVHLKWRQILISIASGTAVYMLLLQVVFK